MDYGYSIVVSILLVFDIQANNEVVRAVALSYNGKPYPPPMPSVFRFASSSLASPLPEEFDMPMIDHPANGPNLSRPAFTCQSLQSLTALALIEGLAAHRLFGNDVQ